MTLRLPESLHRKLAQQAKREGVSLNQYLVYTLTHATTALDLERDRKLFEELRSRFPKSEAERGLRELLRARVPAESS